MAMTSSADTLDLDREAYDVGDVLRRDGVVFLFGLAMKVLQLIIIVSTRDMLYAIDRFIRETSVNFQGALEAG